MLLNIFHTGGLTTGLTIVAAALITWFGYQTFKASKSGGIRQGDAGHPDPYLDNKKTPVFKIPQFWFAVAVLVLYIIAMLVVASDYKGV